MSVPIVHKTLLSAEDLAVFAQDGYVHLRGAVPSSFTDRVLRAVNAELGNGLTHDDAAALKVNAKSFGSEALLDSVAMRSLFLETGLWSQACALFGVHGAALPPYYAQVALRFPHAEGVPLDVKPWHVDNVTTEMVRPFGLLIGVYLTASPAADCGNLTLWPRGHHALQRLFREQGPRAIRRSLTGRIMTPETPLGEPLQLLTGVGDVVFAHPLLPHRAAPNTSPHVRVAVYFRVYHAALPYDHGAACALRTMPLQNLWALGWSGLRPTLEAGALASGEEPPLCDVDPYEHCDCGAPAIPPLEPLRLVAADGSGKAVGGAAVSGGCGGDGAAPSLSDASLFWVRTSFCAGGWLNWQHVRQFIAAEVPPGAAAVLDVGCASGLLLRSLRDWSGVPFAPFGIDVHWVVRLAPRLFVPDAGGAFARCSMEDFLRDGGVQLGAPREYDMVFWNVWDPYELGGEGFAAVRALAALTAPQGKLVLGLYADTARNEKRVADLRAAIGAAQPPLHVTVRVVERPPLPHRLVVLERALNRI
jgi:hypothetical protein